MQRPSNTPIHIQFGLRGWAAIAAAAALLAAVAFLAIGLFLFLLPIIILAPVFYWLAPKPKIYHVGNPAPGQTESNPTIIEGEFRQIDTTEEKPKPNVTLEP